MKATPVSIMAILFSVACDSIYQRAYIIGRDITL